MKKNHGREKKIFKNYKKSDSSYLEGDLEEEYSEIIESGCSIKKKVRESWKR